MFSDRTEYYLEHDIFSSFSWLKLGWMKEKEINSMLILSCKSNWVRTKFSVAFTTLNLASLKLLAAVDLWPIKDFHRDLKSLLRGEVENYRISRLSDNHSHQGRRKVVRNWKVWHPACWFLLQICLITEGWGLLKSYVCSVKVCLSFLFLIGDQARTFFLQSGLPASVLAEIW